MTHVSLKLGALIALVSIVPSCATMNECVSPAQYEAAYGNAEFGPIISRLVGINREQDQAKIAQLVEAGFALPNLTDAARIELYSFKNPSAVKPPNIEKILALPSLTPGQREFYEKKMASVNGFIEDDHNRDAKPLFRVAPRMSRYSENSGHCLMTFDITAVGATDNIEAKYCTYNTFAPSALQAIEQWQYSPRVQDDVPVRAVGITTKVSFVLFDQCGKLLP